MKRASYESTFRHRDPAVVLRRVQRIGAGAPNDLNGATLLGTAAWFGHIEAVVWLLDAGEDINRTAEDGDTPLLSALASIQTHSLPGSFEVARLLLDRGARIDLSGDHGDTPLHRAASIDTSEQIPVMLLAAGANPAAIADGGLTPTHRAARSVNLPMLIALAEAGADVTVADDTGRTALFYALEATSGTNWARQPDGSLLWDGIPVVHWLAEHGVPLDTVLPETGRTVLMDACAHQRPELVRLCLSAGVPVDSTDANGRTALFFADGACGAMLLEAGADPNVRDAEHATVWDTTRPGSDMDLLLQQHGFAERPGIYAGFPDRRGKTKLMFACEREDLAAVQTFVHSGDVNTTDRYGKTALHYLLARRHHDKDTVAVLRALLAAGIDVRIASKVGATALHIIAKHLVPERAIVKALLAGGADPHQPDGRGKTPLEIMRSRSHDPDTLALLVNAAADTGSSGS